MARTICVVLAGLFLAPVALLNAEQPSHSDAVEVTLGQSAVPLNGPWKFTVGDSPLDPRSGLPLWAEPDFDDSGWETVDLTPVPAQSDASTGDPQRVKGWTARGHAGYWGWAWYRLRVKVAAKPEDQVAIDGPTSAEDAWQLFADGQLLGSFGKFDSRGDVKRIYSPRPLMFPLPPVQHTENGEVIETFAFRVWMGPGAGLSNTNGGGLHDAPLLVAGSAATTQSRLDWQEALIRRVDEAAYIALFLLLAVLAASLMLFDPSDRVYPWVAATMLVAPIGYMMVGVSIITTWLDSRVADVLVSTNDALWAAGWVMVWWVWFHFRRPAWVPRATAVLMVFLAAVDALKMGLTDYGIALPHGHNAALVHTLGATSLALRLLFVLAIALVVGAGIRKEGKEGWFALPAVAALAVEMFAQDFGVDVVGRFHGIDVQIWDLTDPFLVAVLVFLMLRRLLRSLKRQRQMALDVKQAQEVQQVILPLARVEAAGFAIESEYRPALEVGGDFFQIIPNEADGSVLIVAGDVTGKGLRAGMLVALLVGAIRSTADWSMDPLVVLQALNQRLLGRGDAQATCLALRIEKDGSVTLANAGHLAPFLNGEAMEMEGALPLGMIEGAEFSVMNFQLSENDRLMLMSDGIAEATDANGTLFGFERVHELLSIADNAAEVANAAQKFGQEDDISVISVTWTPVLSPALA
jgi:hypothetical protein